MRTRPFGDGINGSYLAYLIKEADYMILNYFLFIECIKISAKKKSFVILCICSFFDVLSAMFFVLDKYSNIEIKYQTLKYILVLSAFVFCIFGFRDVVTSKSNKQKTSATLMILFFVLSVILYYIYTINQRIYFFWGLNITYIGYIISRLVYIYQQKNN